MFNVGDDVTIYWDDEDGSEELTGTIKVVTTKATLVALDIPGYADPVERWIPKSQIHEIEDLEWRIPQWLFSKIIFEEE